MSSKRTIIFEAALVIGVLATGLTAAQAAHAAPLQAVLQAADAKANVKIDSKVLVERTEPNAAGEIQTKLYNPSDVKVIPGDRLVFVNTYHNRGVTPVTGFVVNNPIHAAVTFSNVQEEWATVSIDGGKNFGKLTEFTVTENDTGVESVSITRAAQPSDVTHIRWTFDKAIAAGASGELRFSGVVK